MTQWPTMFISHGAPTLAIDDDLAHRFLVDFGKHLGKPEAILLLSAHFEAPVATVTASPAPKTIYDFGGFPDELYNIRYPAPGDPELAQRTSGLFQAGGLSTIASLSRGLDHGAWVPLSLLYPDADVPYFGTEFGADDVLLEYRSARNLCSLAEGLALGLGDWFETPLSVTHVTCVHRGDDGCRMAVTEQPSPA